jgi:hypothetical protein
VVPATILIALGTETIFPSIFLAILGLPTVLCVRRSE